jgi:CheY-like chemotaxis protein
MKLERFVSNATLAGHPILVAEDEPIIALEVTGMLRDAGCVVAGPFRSVDDALVSVIHQTPSAAVLDFGLCGQSAIPVADMLACKGVPFVWLTAYPRSVLPERHRERPLVDKPFSPTTLLEALAALGVADERLATLGNGS